MAAYSSTERADVGAYLKTFTESHGRGKCLQMFTEAWKQGKIKKEQISIKNLAERLVGPQWPVLLPGRYRAIAEGKRFTEATEAVDSSSFVDITGQLLVQEIKEKYEAADMVATKLVSTEQITNGNLGVQRVPWLSKISTGPRQIQQAGEYGQAKFTEQWIDLPGPEKWGDICAITFEMIFSDLTKQVFESAGSLGEWMAINKEYRIAATVMGIGTRGNTHSWNGTSYNTYLTSGAWINKISGKVIQDWSDLNDLEQVFARMKDPVTNKPIKIKPNAVLIMPYRYYNWKRIQQATGTRTGPFATSGLTPQTEAPSPLDYNYPIQKSQYFYDVLISATTLDFPDTGLGLTAAQANEYVFMGDFKKAFVWRSVYDAQTVEAPPGHPADFNQDIQFMVKCSSYGAPGVLDPRFVLMSYNN